MSEKTASYIVSEVTPITLNAFKKLNCARVYTDEKYTPPTPQQVAQLINLAGWSQADAAKLVGVSWSTDRGSSTIRKWKTKKEGGEYRPIPYSSWRLFLLYAGVVTIDDGLKAIDKPVKNLK